MRTISAKYAFKYENDKNASLPLTGKINRSKRQIRNQVINNVTVAELIKHIGYGPLAYGEQTVSSAAKAHHIGEVQIIRNDGARYIYGLPAYNIEKQEVTVSTSHAPDCRNGLVGYHVSAINDKNYKDLPYDKYYNKTNTPGYVHTHLLTSVLSTDYQDVDDNGPSDLDKGSYTNIKYVKNPNNKP